MKAKIWNKKQWLNDILLKDATLKNDFEQMLKHSGFTILGFQEHKFEPQGYSALWLLAESHFAIHTFPEHNKIYIELSSCNGNKQKEFKRLLKSWYVYAKGMRSI